MTTIYVARPDALLIVNGQGDRWEVKRKLENLSAQCVAADPRRPERIYCGTFGHGLWRSDDGGESWERSDKGITQGRAMAVAVSANERAGDWGVVYAGTEPTALFRSEDGAVTWQECSALRMLPSAPTWSFPPRPYTSHVRSIVLDPASPGRLYVAIEAGALVRSLDGGRTWLDRTPTGPIDSHTLATHPGAPGRVYAAAGDGFMAPGEGYAETTDGGETWHRLGQGIARSYLWGLAVDPADPETVVVSGAHSPNHAHNPHAAEASVYRKSGAAGWEEARDGLPEARGTLAFSLASNRAEPGVFYAAGNRGVYRSADAGRRWQRLDIEWPDEYRLQHVQGLAVL